MPFSELYEKLPKRTLLTSFGKYVIFDIAVRQITAHLLCGVIGHLLIIDTEQELDSVVPNDSTRYWTDLEDFEEEGKYVSLLTGQQGIQRWGTGEPGNATRMDCVYIFNRKL